MVLLVELVCSSRRVLWDVGGKWFLPLATSRNATQPFEAKEVYALRMKSKLVSLELGVASGCSKSMALSPTSLPWANQWVSLNIAVQHHSSLGNGYPVAAVVCRREVAESFASSGIEYFNTYGGNSVACAIAESVFDTIKEGSLQENALHVGHYLTSQLQSLQEKYPQWVGDVRGVGLFQGIEIVHPRRNLSEIPRPYPELTKFLVDYLRYQRVIVSRDGPDENVIKIKPPLVFSRENVDTLVRGLEEGIQCAIENKLF